jgi:hypothetical protein
MLGHFFAKYKYPLFYGLTKSTALRFQASAYSRPYPYMHPLTDPARLAEIQAADRRKAEARLQRLRRKRL